jgi:hypothetical protein
MSTNRNLFLYAWAFCCVHNFSLVNRAWVTGRKGVGSPVNENLFKYLCVLRSERLGYLFHHNDGRCVVRLGTEVVLLHHPTVGTEVVTHAETGAAFLIRA